MSYFSHAFNKAFVGTKATQPSTPTTNEVNVGMLNQAGIPTAALKNVGAPNGLGVGTYGFFNKTTYLSVTAASPEVTTGQALVLAGASLMGNDKIGPFHGGYQESNKSKYINPKLVTNFYKMTSAVPQQSIWHIGVTNFQSGTTLTLTTAGIGCAANGTYTNVPVSGGAGIGMTVDVVIVGGVVISVVENQVGTGYLVGNVVTLDPDPSIGLTCGTFPTFTVAAVGTQNCEFEFLCGETYNLFINLHGAPVLRYLNHDSYRLLAAYTGCCPEDSIVPVAVDSTLVMIDWANQMITSPYLKEFVRPIVFDETNTPFFATAAEAVAAGWPATQVWTNYVSTGHIPGALAGIRLVSAFVDTRFGTCTFQTSDYYGREVVQMDLSLSDENGDPCTFNGLCVEQECCGIGGQGFGDTYVRELILAESYLQNKFSTDLRIREITQGNDIFNALPPVNGLNQPIFYDKYVIQHIVPRYNNPSSVHDDDQYNLMIYVPTGAPAVALENFMQVWLIAAGNPLGDQLASSGIETFGNNVCPVVPIPIPLADLRIVKTVDNSTPNVGDTITFTVTVSNTSATNPATGVVVTDNIPDGYTVQSVSGPSVGTWVAPTWTIGTLAPGASETLGIRVTVLATGNYNNTATVISTAGQDPVPGNNTSSVEPIVVTPPVP
jgi:uncharacterized repeat protein (TIGR01451 family)